jgi:hypothetical protein
MPYSSFTLSQVQAQFDLNVSKGVFLTDLPRLSARKWFEESLAVTAPFAAAQGSEKVLSELIIAPLLFELRELLVGVASPRRIARSVYSLGSILVLTLNLD